ncbi:hypothetical protein VISI1226_05930 [Vibrio sinaloensis DSM 21326]|uniref:Uncharacterized protein n=1 Tax=Vibrio sinaloensis DSM 21326 TaxID=945550 RepID=E8MBQ0_PHOS4|nr:hypothetical protein [Vibrio sinaloensis]EGA68557.1 hypothetical protein VISI1226_05930 [Vibrio sinaloensis DSM 21326]
MRNNNVSLINMNRVLTFIIGLFFYSTYAYSLDIESLVEYSDRGPSIDYVLTNNQDHDLFISTKIFELEVGDTGEIVEKEYTADNLDEWQITLSEAKFILRVGESRVVTAYRINGGQNLSSDDVFKVRFSPNAVNEKKNTVAINYGYGILSIFETSGQTSRIPEVSLAGKKIEINNKTNKFLEARVCNSKRECEFSSVYYILPGRKTAIDKPDDINNEAYIQFSTNDGSFDYEATL